MLQSIQTLKGLTIGATDGHIGEVEEAYFDDQRWTIRYLVTATGGWATDGWLSGRKVLVSPRSIQRIDWAKRVVRSNLNCQQVKNSPPVDADKPVSRQHELENAAYYGFDPFWAGSDLIAPLSGALLPVVPLPLTSEKQARSECERAHADPHLRSSRDVVGYYVGAIDGDIGHIDDILFDEYWTLRYFVIDTRNWWPGKHVLISPTWIDRLEWTDQKVFVNLNQVEVESCPEYQPSRVLARDYEEALHRHYQKPTYWKTWDGPVPPRRGP